MPATATSGSTKQWAREYETVYIMRPTVAADTAEGVANRVKELVAKFGGKLTKVDNWGHRQLAYEISRHRRGLFVYVRYAAVGEVVAELERNLRLLDEVIRYQTILIDDRVDLNAVNVDPDEVEFLPIEEEPEEEEWDRAKELGLVPREPRRERFDAPDAAKAKPDEGDAAVADAKEAPKAAAAEEAPKAAAAEEAPKAIATKTDEVSEPTAESAAEPETKSEDE